MMIDACKELMASRFPFLNGDDIDMILCICAKNKSLYCLPEEKPEYIFGFYRFFPVLAKSVMDQDFPLLLDCDLTMGPIVYIAVLVAPRDGYGVTRRLLDSIDPPPYAFCCHRHNIDDKWRFQWKLNSHRPRVTIQ